MSSKKKLSGWPVLFIGPHMILFILFFLVPAVIGVYVSFTEWDLFSSPIFIGLDNFKTILFDQDSLYHTQFFNGMKNTLFFAVISVPLCIAIPLLLAVALSAKPKMMRFFQSVLYLPTLFAISAVMIIWGFLLSKSFGPIKEVFGIDINFVGTQPRAWIAILIVTIWWTLGGNLIIYVAALNGVPREQMEAAELDGASSVVKFFRISLPSIRNQLIFTTVMTTIAQFNIYGQPLMLTGGGPNNSTRVLMMYIQENAFGSSTSVAGMSSAMAILLGIVIMIVSVFQFIMIKKLER
ncbi:sugar ABC transporter permease [Enterococcus gallinarum]|uniref:carbohydrate ABC transporter permease n=1 Tax=Enterococcus gallinarum TaxID=1353 RepID=UPI002DB7BD6F|nr:sugar ABC transporter permease [Enterococcus gallinarum]MEB5882201.1 sugar ABC transporter permease [Enterococcus gallinarum]